MRKLGLISLGCAKNRVDAEHLLAGLTRRGFELVEDPAEAEVVIVNTCGFIREAVEESVEEILQAALLKKDGACRVLAVAGCLAKRYPEMAPEMPEVDHFFTPEDLPRIPEVLGAAAGLPDAPTLPGPRCGPGPGRILTQPPHTAYLKIAEGCSNRCTYCTIPAIRGPFRSHAEDQLVAEAQELAGLGVVELNLVAQDVTSYGGDTQDPAALTRLLRRLAAIDGLAWLRLLYAYPGRLPAGLAELLAEGGKLLPYLDVPIQHIHPRILRAMGRRTSAEEVEALLVGLQETVPGLVLRTTTIVGFPGETEEEFDALVALIRRVRFHHLGAFLYSPEEGTPAARLRPRIPVKVGRQRLDRLLEAQAEISETRNREFLGRTLDVLVEGVDEEGEVVGRTYGQAPEVDGFTRLSGYEGEIEIGAFVRARITGADTYDLRAEVTER
ncbi:MAG: 30S ribosomal protein S12 methylthiotransferase RimO [Deltaproteobacteria bacterium]|nr:30S ribosomal protein S12 methylthiotransferase RimO [Deltaproteobacteria bacterium]